MLTIRQRKPGGAWYVRGSVRIGKKTRQVTEHSTGTPERGTAQSYLATLQTEIERELLYGTPPAPRRVGWEDALELRLAAPLNKSEISRLRMLDLHFECWVLNDIESDDWKKFVAKRLRGRAANTVNNYRKTLRNVFRAGGVEPPAMEATRKDARLVRWLAKERADALTAAYPERLRPAALLARYQGMRAGEIVRLDWGDIDLERAFLHVRVSKTGVGRFLPLHPVITELLAPGGTGRVIKTKGGDALPDPRVSGHNPFDGAHRYACGKIGLKDFRFHDWRHHWATWFMIEGGDLRSLQMLGGWSSLKMVECYAAVCVEHAGRLQARIA